VSHCPSAADHDELREKAARAPSPDVRLRRGTGRWRSRWPAGARGTADFEQVLRGPERVRCTLRRRPSLKTPRSSGARMRQARYPAQARSDARRRPDRGTLGRAASVLAPRAGAYARLYQELGFEARHFQCTTGLAAGVARQVEGAHRGSSPSARRSLVDKHTSAWLRSTREVACGQ